MSDTIHRTSVPPPLAFLPSPVSKLLRQTPLPIAANIAARAKPHIADTSNSLALEDVVHKLPTESMFQAPAECSNHRTHGSKITTSKYKYSCSLLFRLSSTSIVIDLYRDNRLVEINIDPPWIGTPSPTGALTSTGLVMMTLGTPETRINTSAGTLEADTLNLHVAVGHAPSPQCLVPLSLQLGRTH